jgi:hypothetical protein
MSDKKKTSKSKTNVKERIVWEEQQTKKNDMPVSSSKIPIPLYLPNIIGYIRIITLIVSWKFAFT